MQFCLFEISDLYYFYLFGNFKVSFFISVARLSEINSTVISPLWTVSIIYETIISRL